jgi:hypothetical protein
MSEKFGKEYKSAWHQTNREEQNEKARRKYWLNKDELNKKSREFYAKNRASKLDKCRLQKYGISPEDYKKALDLQNGVCAICKKPCTCGRSLAVDHNHETGWVRGLLCSKCNRAIGLFKDSRELLLEAASYLENRDKPSN